MKLTSMLRTLSNSIDNFIMKAVFLSIVGMLLAITLQIIFRVFFDALTWTEELSRYLLVWSTFLGATLAYKRGMHISVTFCVNLFAKKMQKTVIIFSILLSMIFFAVVIVFGFKYMAMQALQVSAALRMPMKWVYIVIPMSFIVMSVHGVTAILEEIFDIKEVNLQ